MTGAASCPAQHGAVRSPAECALRDSAFVRGGGFAVLSGLLSGELRRQMLGEALERLSFAEESYAPAFDGEEVRGGTPARRFLNASGGGILSHCGAADGMVEALAGIVGVPLVCSGTGTYSYYGRPGDYLGIHRDILACDVAAISCLHDTPRDDSAGLLCLYPQSIEMKLSHVRRHPDRGVVGLRLEPGQTLVIAGGMVPHAVLPVADRQLRIVALCCYEATLDRAHL
jgi:hypothetical protein